MAGGYISLTKTFTFFRTVKRLLLVAS